MRRRRQRAIGIPDSPETTGAKKKVARWLFNLQDAGLYADEAFLTIWAWCTGGTQRVFDRIESALAEIPDLPNADEARGDLQHILANKRRNYDFWDDMQVFIEDHPLPGKFALDLVRAECAAKRKISRTENAVYARARGHLKRMFGLRPEQIDLCEFVYIAQRFGPSGNYFNDALGIFALENYRLLTVLLEMEGPVLQKCIDDLTACAILQPNGRNGSDLNLQPDLLSLWESCGEKRPGENFCPPIDKKSLPLGDFKIPPEELAHVKSLLLSEESEPLHILLYGPPGTGKTTFASSLARALNLRAWRVPCSGDGDGKGRKVALHACLNLASRHKGAFVLLDEAERVLDTGDRSSRTTADKAWLNRFLEEPGRRVVWIVNDVGQIDASVRRRFTYSIRFGELNGAERKKVWLEVLGRHRAKGRIPGSEIERLSREYKAPTAAVESAVRQAKALARAGHDFAGSVELALGSYLTLSGDGAKPRALHAEEAYTEAGVTLEGGAAELLDRCRRIDARWRGGLPMQPGGGTFLFYGPPGTGKTALARHVARELGRECAVKRASDLLSCWVGASEKNVADAFRIAEADGSVLVIDEADSLLYSREIAVHSWESTLVNEFLTSLEEHRGFCICTTNRLQNLDAAALRRFAVKIPFGYAGPEQVESLYRSLLSPLATVKLEKDEKKRLLGLTSLTPGDFKTVRSQFWLMDRGEVTHRQLIDGLAAEQRIRQNHGDRRIGF